MPRNPDATILIPTYNRPDNIGPLVGFLKSHLDSSQVLIKILDGSDPACASQNQDYCLANGIDYQYYDSNVSFYERLLDGIKQVKTPLLMLHADDDVVNPAGLLQSVDFLKTHPEYVSAHGSYLSFQADATKGYRFWNRYPKQRSYEESSVVYRLFALFSKYIPVHYAVHRTDVMKMIYAEVASNVAPTDYKMFEYLAAALLLTQGQVKTVDGFYMARETGQSTGYIYRHTNSAQEVFREEFFERYSRFRSCLKKYLPVSDVDAAVADDVIDLIFSAHISGYLNQRFLKGQLDTLLQGNVPLHYPVPTKTLKYYMRHPGKLFPNPPNYNKPPYQTVVSFLMSKVKEQSPSKDLSQSY